MFRTGEKDPWNLNELRLAQGSVEDGHPPEAAGPAHRGVAGRPSPTCHREEFATMASIHPLPFRPARFAGHPELRPSRLTQALATLAAAAFAQGALAQATLPEVRVGARAVEPANERASVGGLSDAPLAETPQSISVIRASTLRELGASSLSSTIRSETSVSDAYNTVGYIESIQVRGFLLDNAQNYRRDGLAISNHAPLALENKEAVEILKGVSGIQAGVSAPGGLVNYVLKRPTSTPLRDVFLGLSERGTALAHADFGGRAGQAGQFGYRVNVSAEARRPEPNDAHGQRRFVSGFFDWRLPNRALLEAEFEYATVRQFSVPGFGLFDSNGDGVADTLPAPFDPRLNLGAQPWAQPFESASAIGSLRFQQALSDKWLYGLRYGQQRIRTNDRLAFPDGCSSGPAYVYPGFCGNGDFDVYDYRSDDERRTARTAEGYVRGEFATGAVRHELGVGLRQVRYSERYQPQQAYNWVGVSNVYHPVALPEDPTPTSPNTQRDVRTNELWLTDTMRIGAGWSLWLGLRHTQLDRSSERTDGADTVRYEQSFTTPWAALGWEPWKGGFGYVSWGQGVESEFVPNRPSRYVNAGEVLPALRSDQAEIGFKQVLPGAGLASATLFTITKPFADDVVQPDGKLLREAGAREARHRGLELAWTGRPTKSLALQAQATLIDAETLRSPNPDAVGKHTTNVAPVAASVFASWLVPGANGVAWTNRVFFSGRKPVTPDNSVELPSYWQWDTALAWRQRTGFGFATWRAGIDNVFDRRYWRDAPTQYWGGIYLFPALPRTFRASVQLSF
jgi:iron complex outermembrane receptor protein